MTEIIDIYDANLTLKGQMERRAAHLAGEWHVTFHCWVYRSSPTPALLLQQRSPSATNFPGLLDVSAAGHLEAGETPLMGIREITEELGIHVDESRMLFAGHRVEVADQTNGQLNREYQAVYFLEVPASESFMPEPAEVFGLWWLGIADGCRLFSSEQPLSEANVEGLVWDESTGVFEQASRSVKLEDFLPRVQRYYLAALISADRALHGLPLAIS